MPPYPAPSYEVMPEGSPELVDLLSLSSFVLLKKDMLKGMVAPSDAVGWLRLYDPSPAVPVCRLDSKSTPAGVTSRIECSRLEGGRA